ncbi:autotransporter outer membrane beta-barrel domain-containing protein [Enterobacter vonholyi]
MSQVLSFGADAGLDGLLYGLSASLLQAESERGGDLRATAKAGSAGGWAALTHSSGAFAQADLRALRLNQTLLPDAALGIPPGDMNQNGLTSRLRAGYRWQTADGGTALVPWVRVTGGWLSGSRLAGAGNALTQQAGGLFAYGAGVDARHTWRTAGGTGLTLTGGVSATRRASMPGVTLEDAVQTRRYRAMSDGEHRAWAGAELQFSGRLTAGLTASRRDDGVVRENALTAGLRVAF